MILSKPRFVYGIFLVYYKRSCMSYRKMTAGSEEGFEEIYRKDFPKLLPSFNKKSHKGQAGRIGLIGGSIEYCGALYFASMGALRSGADLAYIFTGEKVAPVLKNYSPDLIVLPFLEKPSNVLTPFLERLHTLVIGPGLGRNEDSQKSVLKIVEQVKKMKGTNCIPLIIDADGIQLVLKDIELFKSYMGSVYLTPNVNEFKILYAYFKGSFPIEDKIQLQHVQFVTEKLGANFTLVVKGESDLIVNDSLHVECTEKGSFKRCGGQGDLLSGILGTVSYWAQINHFSHDEKKYSPEMLASYIACMTVRKSSKKTFEILGRSMQASDILHELPSVFKDTFGNDW